MQYLSNRANTRSCLSQAAAIASVPLLLREVPEPDTLAKELLVHLFALLSVGVSETSVMPDALFQTLADIAAGGALSCELLERELFNPLFALDLSNAQRFSGLIGIRSLNVFSLLINSHYTTYCNGMELTLFTTI